MSQLKRWNGTDWVVTESGNVTLDTDQTITGEKTFSDLLVTRGAENLLPVVTGNPTPVKITVTPSASPPAAPAVDDIWIVSDASPPAGSSSPSVYVSREIDYAERGTSFDFLAVGTTYSDIEGLRLTVPPQTTPYFIEFGGIVNFTSGTAAAGSAMMAYISLNDITNNKVYGYTSATGYIANITTQQSVRAGRRIEPHAETRTYQVQGRVSSIVTGWSTVGLLATDSPVSGLWPPAYFRAVLL
jgi:hypothetical protein